MFSASTCIIHVLSTGTFAVVSSVTDCLPFVRCFLQNQFIPDLYFSAQWRWRWQLGGQRWWSAGSTSSQSCRSQVLLFSTRSPTLPNSV